MAKKNQLLRAAFRDTLDPKMATLGFQTAFPNYRRVEGNCAHIGEIQWGKNGGYFLFEFGRAELPFLDWTDKEVPLQSLTVSHFPPETRARLANTTGRNPDEFHYAEFFDDRAKIDALVERLASYVDQANEWLKTGMENSSLVVF